MENGKSQKKEKDNSSVMDIVKFAIFVAAIIIPFRIFIAQPYIVEGSSMDPTFKDGDYLIVDQVSSRFETPKRGEVIIMKYPKDPSKYFIKRVIGLPLETVVIEKGKVFIKKPGESTTTPLNEDYIAFDKPENFSTTLKESEYFVMGDNRSGSSDSRIWGPLPAENVVGRPLLRLLPVDHLGIFPGSKENIEAE
jgi:signal peptidase I